MNRTSPLREVTPVEARQLLAEDQIHLIDVREPDEVQIAAVAGARLYPLSQAAYWIDALPDDKPLVIMCHHGVRSTQVALALLARDRAEVANLTGGIDAWSASVDPTIPRY